MSSAQPVFRFAPSPNGLLHLGHAYSALFNACLAEAAGGTLLLRIEDIDRDRCTPAFEAAIFEDLGWLGLRWPTPVRRQSEHFARYGAALDVLAARGLVYPCFCTRGDIAARIAARADWPRDPDGAPLYPGTCRAVPERERATRIAAAQPYALRLNQAAAQAECAQAGLARAMTWVEYREGDIPAVMRADPADWGDAVLRRKDIPASYHVAVVVDDALQGVTDVARGEDLSAATALHRLLQTLLGLPEPRYHHHRLVLDEAGRKLAKSRLSPGLAERRRSGITAAEIRHALGFD